MSWEDLKTKNEIEAERRATHEQAEQQIRSETATIEAQIVSKLERLKDKLAEWSGMDATIQAKPGFARVWLFNDYWGLDVAPDRLSFTFVTNDESEQISYNRQPGCNYWEINNSQHVKLDVMAHFIRSTDAFVARLRQKGMLKRLT